MNPLAIFRNTFPDTRLIEIPGELRYRLTGIDILRAYEYVAGLVIVGRKLPLVAIPEFWSSRGTTAIELVVRMAPEQDVIERSCADEVQDGEGLSGGWWGRNEE